MKKIALITLITMAFFVLAGCLVTHPTTAPPPAKKEIRSAKPGPMFVWITGHWKWTGSNYSWTSGHWLKAPKGKVRVQGHWKKRGGNWVWISGHWKRR